MAKLPFLGPCLAPLTRAGALLLATVAIVPIAANRLLAQAPGALPDPASIPTELPAVAVLRLDGSSSMVLANENLRDRFLQRPNAAIANGAATQVLAPPERPSPEAIAPPASSPVATATPAQDTAPPGPAAETAPAGLPWWLLGIPVGGGLLWWLLKGKGRPLAPLTMSPEEPVSRVPPPNSKTAEPARRRDGAAISKTCAIQTLTVHSRHNAVLLRGDQMQYLQDQVAATYSLDPGSYILRIKAGTFSYGNDSPSEPWVLLWIYGGQVSNLKTGVWVNGTWSTLNGYADTLSLEVDEPAQLCAFFIDTFPENNTSAVTLSVIRL